MLLSPASRAGRKRSIAAVSLNKATSAQVLAGTDDTTFVTPLKAAQSLRSAKAWALFNGNTAVITSSFNVASVTRNAAGSYTVTLTTAMADANYTVVANQRLGIGNIPPVITEGAAVTKTTTQFSLANNSSTGTGNDSNFTYFVVFGN